MRVATVLKALDALRKAERAMMEGNVSISRQINIGGECWHAWLELRQELEHDCPDLKLEVQNAV